MPWALSPVGALRGSGGGAGGTTGYPFTVSETVVSTVRAAVGPALRKKGSSSTWTARFSETAVSVGHRSMEVSAEACPPWTP